VAERGFADQVLEKGDATPFSLGQHQPIAAGAVKKGYKS
jgi:hypothetical protein